MFICGSKRSFLRRFFSLFLDMYLNRNRERESSRAACFPVLYIICPSPIAPLLETALGSASDSAKIKALIKSGLTLCRGLKKVNCE